MDAGTWFTQLNAWQVMALGLVFFGGIYLLGGLFMGMLTGLLARRGIGRPLDTRPLKSEQLRREWRQSFHSILIFGIGMIVPWGFLQLGWARLSPTASSGRIALEIFALLIWNDVHFWINHRLLHTRRLVRYHGDHHRSVVTTPWSTYSFHPIEALMLGNIILLPMLVHDFYFWSLASVPVLSLILNLIGHSNYDFFPRVSDTHPLAASRRHHLHHARPAGNYGFALAFMDQIMRTRVTDSAPHSPRH
ncbi:MULTISPECIES: sterol desaturase family protein [Comamonas]|jgi:sterol desaturase/sphingolipid hydroxylase (fatty acid hydroxylase superfamily)|uniref:sterol desaturase family protein n=1 Tax=Comamonas TaxID=283 RepID=UPI0012D213C4|nr:MULTISPECIES: sterol desaturase family protein [Comamonas]MDR3065285.1 sterol desaturase family protein [Comamonas sp.]MEB5963693.1 sterol desaturase family protein [Comamonas testosteroni]MPS96275.1 fatty acid hydroxylase family protein [Comamonas sp.]